MITLSRFNPTSLKTPERTRKVASENQASPAHTAQAKMQLHAGRWGLSGIRFGNTTPPETTVIKPESVSFTENVGLDFSTLRSLAMPEPQTTWPLFMMKLLLRDPDVRKFLEDKCDVKRFDVFYGIDHVALPFVRQANVPEQKLDEKYYQSKIRSSIKEFSASQGFDSVTPLLIWRWLMTVNPSGNIDTLLNNCGFEKKTVNGVEVGPFDQDTIKKLKNPPAIEVPPVGPSKPRKLTKEEILALRNAIEELPKIVIGQDEGINEIVEGIRVARNGYDFDADKPNQPKVRMLLLGPSGVGKTFAAKKLAQRLGRSVVYVSFSEYTNAASATNLQGSAQGYVGSKDQNFIKEIKEKVEKAARDKTPPPLIIIDELEKAAPEVRKTIMQALDEGVMYTNTREPVIFKDCDIIMTSNIAQKEIAAAQFKFEEQEKALLEEGAVRDSSEETVAQALETLHAKQKKELEISVEAQMDEHIAPDFKGRISKKIIFKSLTEKSARIILDQQLGKLAEAAKERDGYDLEVDQSVKDEIIRTGFKRDTGVRTLKDELNRLLHSPLTRRMEEFVLNNQDPSGGKITARWQGNDPEFEFTPLVSLTPPATPPVAAPQPNLAGGAERPATDPSVPSPIEDVKPSNATIVEAPPSPVAGMPQPQTPNPEKES